MEKLSFEGNLSSISPSALINKDKKEDFESFFLILAMIFNDLKGLIFFQKLIEDNYRKPETNEVSAHLGEFAGIMTQTNKFIISTVNEFAIFLDKNSGVTSSPKFLLLLKKLDKKSKLAWAQIVNPNSNEDSLLSKIARIRSNVSFHYDHSNEELRKGFIRSFFSEGKNLIQHQKAYFSLGDDMKLTRFYFADAAVEEYIKSLFDVHDSSLVRSVIENMNHALQSLLRAYMLSIVNKKKG